MEDLFYRSESINNLNSSIIIKIILLAVKIQAWILDVWQNFKIQIYKLLLIITKQIFN